MAWWADGNSPSVWSEKARSVSGWIFLGPRTLYCASNRCGEDAPELVFAPQVPRVRVGGRGCGCQDLDVLCALANDGSRVVVQVPYCRVR